MQLDKATISRFTTDPKALTSRARKGAGAFSTVRKSTIEGMVVKTSKCLYSDAWVAFAAAVICLKDKRPGYLPRIEALVIDEKKGTYYAIMEELLAGPRRLYFHFPLVSGDSDAAPAIRQFWRKVRDCATGANGETEPQKMAAKSLPRNLPGFTQVVRRMLRCSPSFTPDQRANLYGDLHSGNMMRRPGTGELVLTDPFVWDGWFSNKGRKWPEVIKGLKSLSRSSKGRIIFI